MSAFSDYKNRLVFIIFSAVVGTFIGKNKA